MNNVTRDWYLYLQRFRPCLNTTELIISYLKKRLHRNVPLKRNTKFETKHGMSFTCGGEMYRWIQCDFLFVVVLVVSVLPAATISISSSTLSQSKRKEHLPRQSIEIGINKMKREKKEQQQLYTTKRRSFMFI